MAPSAQQQLIIGIDFGTSNSGAAYALFDGPSKGQVDVEVIRGWPQTGINYHHKSSDKVPSRISYDEQAKVTGFGFDAVVGGNEVQWMKLLLEPETQRRAKKAAQLKISQQVVEKLGKAPIEVVAEYLKWLWERIVWKICDKEQDQSIMRESKVTVVMTQPAVWSERAKHNMMQAVKCAGIDDGSRTLKFITEPEAAATFELKVKARKGQIQENDCIVVCDAGGGTVDVVSYQLRSGEPLVLDQCVVGDGDFCGCVFVDLAFTEQVSSVLADDMDRLSLESKARILETFEYNIKPFYSPDVPRKYAIDVPGVSDDADRGILQSKMDVDSAMLHASFEVVMTQIMSLIDRQRDGLKAKGLEDQLKGILLVGGFGASDFLHKRIRQEYPEDDGIKIWRGDQSWTSVVQGAVLCECLGLGDIKPVERRLSRWNYGVIWKTQASKYVEWLVRRGQPIEPGSQIRPYRFGLLIPKDSYGKDEVLTLEVSLVRSASEDASEELTAAVEPFADIHCRVPASVLNSPDITNAQWASNYSTVPADLVLCMDQGMLSIRCQIHGQDVGTVDISFHDVAGEGGDSVDRRASFASDASGTVTASARKGSHRSESNAPNRTPVDAFYSVAGSSKAPRDSAVDISGSKPVRSPSVVTTASSSAPEVVPSTDPEVVTAFPVNQKRKSLTEAEFRLWILDRERRRKEKKKRDQETWGWAGLNT